MPLRVVQVFRSQVEPMLQLVKAEEVACRAQEVQQERAFELDVHQVRRKSRGNALSLLGWEQQAVVVASSWWWRRGRGLLTSCDPRGPTGLL